MSRLKNEKIQKECLRTSSCIGLTDVIENRWNTIKDGFCKAADATLKYQGENKKE